MEIAFVITLYKQPRLAEMLLQSLQHPGFHFYLHIDKKAKAADFEHLFNMPRTYRIRERYDIRWAGYSMVEALLAGLEAALSADTQYDLITHISGQDLPIKPAREIYDFFAANTGKNFLSCEAFPNDWWNEARTRYQHYHFQDIDFRGKHRLAKLMTRILPGRKLPFDYTMYGGPLGAYWTFSRETAAYVADYMRKHREVRSFFRKSWGPDEFLFNTIVMNSPYKEMTVNNNHRYIDWSQGGGSPKLLDVSDFEKLSSSPCFFARKFDLEHDSKIVDMIREKLLFCSPV